MADSQPRILIIEDEALICMLLEDVLQGLGCAVVGPAMTVDHAERLARSEEVHFAVLDVNLGRGDSFGVAEILAGKGVPFAFITGYGKAGVRKDLQHAPVLQKPIDIDRLEQILRENSVI
jgi:DNA-binding NtrC family response regulator